MLLLSDLRMRERDRTAIFPVRSNQRWRPAAILKISNGHISATHYPLHFMYVHRPMTIYFALGRCKDSMHMRLDTYLARGGGNESTCVIKRKNETADLEK